MVASGRSVSVGRGRIPEGANRAAGSSRTRNPLDGSWVPTFTRAPQKPGTVSGFKRFSYSLGRNQTNATNHEEDFAIAGWGGRAEHVFGDVVRRGGAQWRESRNLDLSRRQRMGLCVRLVTRPAVQLPTERTWRRTVFRLDLQVWR